VALGDRLGALRAAPVDLSPAEVDVFYERISNAVLWPVFHDRLDRVPLLVEGWDVYEAVNARFADAVVDQHRPGDLVWVHDYQLLRLPALLRARAPGARVGFFLHIPFPGPDAFAVLPTRRWLLEGVLGADLVGFHTAAYRDHFREAVRRFLPEVPVGEVGDPDTLRVGGRVVRLGVFPMGVDAAALAAHAETPEVAAETARIRAPGLRLLVGVDRLDYSKGIPRRLLSFEQLLLRHPEWRERVRLVQVAVPSRVGVAEYQHFREQLDALVGRINGAFGTPTWTPIHYMYRAVDETDAARPVPRGRRHARHARARRDEPGGEGVRRRARRRRRACWC
jgi:trehalose 6-phosphate synthase/phosphatase